MPAPSIDPEDLDPAEIAPADSYRPADPVWVYRAGRWRAGVVVAASSRAATVTYRPTPGPATAVDTLTAAFLFPRADVDPVLDTGSATGLATRAAAAANGAGAALPSVNGGQDAAAGP